MKYITSCLFECLHILGRILETKLYGTSKGFIEGAIFPKKSILEAYISLI